MKDHDRDVVARVEVLPPRAQRVLELGDFRRAVRQQRHLNRKPPQANAVAEDNRERRRSLSEPTGSVCNTGTTRLRSTKPRKTLRPLQTPCRACTASVLRPVRAVTSRPAHDRVARVRAVPRGLLPLAGLPAVGREALALAVDTPAAPAQGVPGACFSAGTNARESQTTLFKSSKTPRMYNPELSTGPGNSRTLNS